MGGNEVLHYDGNSWSNVDNGLRADRVALRDIWGSSQNDVWIVDSYGAILNYDGEAWSTKMSGGSWRLEAVWGSSADDVWVVGPAGTVIRFDGNDWLPVDIGMTADLHDVWGSSAEDVWMVGEDGTILHYGGGVKPLMPGLVEPSTDEIDPLVGTEIEIGSVGDISDIPGFPGAQAVTGNVNIPGAVGAIMGQWKDDLEKEGVAYALYSTGDTPGEVSAWYQAQMPGQGWKTEMALDIPQQGSILAFSNQQRVVSSIFYVFGDSDSGETMIFMLRSKDNKD